jgi:LuxR family transcriptional regulator, maltose regulon positive regulatory protein
MAGRPAADSSALAPATGPAPVSKLTIPIPPDWTIQRTRLMDRLTRGSRGPLTVVTGPPGAGKTVAVAAWALSGRAPGPVAWLSLEDGDGRPDAFWPLLREALRRAGVPATPAGTSWADDRQAVTGLAADLASRDSSAVIVLDDLQAIRGPSTGVSTGVEGLAYLAKHAATGLRMVLVSRRDPPLALQRYRLAGALGEIRTSDLAFGERETRELLIRRGVSVSPEAARTLRDRTEGWAAGISLAAMSMAAHPDPESYVAELSGDDHAIASYLIEEVLDALPADQRRLLLATSVVARVNAELAAELAGVEAEGLFPDLVQQIAFVQPLEHGWYRYHHLFTEAMQLVLHHESPSLAAELHRRAAAWFDREGLLTEAVRHATLARDWQYACWLVATRMAIGQVLGIGVDAPLTRHFRAMPPEVASTGTEPEPAIVAAAEALARGDDQSCGLALKQAEEILAELPEDHAVTARLAAGVVRVARPQPGDADAIRRVAGDAASMLVRSGAALDRRPELRALLLAACGLADLWAGRLTDAADRYGAALADAAVAGGDFQRRSYLSTLALVAVLLGRLGRAAELVAQAARLPEVPGSPAGRPDPTAHLARGWVQLAGCRPAETRRELEHARRALEAGPDACLSTLYGLLAARLAVSEGRPDRALASLTVARDSAAGLSWLEHRVLVATAEVLLASDDPAAARAVAERAGPAADAMVILARAQLCAGDDSAARATMRTALADSATASPDVRVEAWLTDAQIAYGASDSSRGRRSLDRALRVADRERLSLPFALSRSWLVPILRRDPDLVRGHRQVLEPLRVMADRPAGQPHGVEPLVFERLSPRELEVLRHLSTMMTTEEIAAATYLSANTVKTHLKSIYRKLAVTRRNEAVRRARQLALL